MIKPLELKVANARGRNGWFKPAHVHVRPNYLHHYLKGGAYQGEVSTVRIDVTSTRGCTVSPLMLELTIEDARGLAALILAAADEAEIRYQEKENSHEAPLDPLR